MSKPILCLDFDGVIHTYSTPWESETVIPDLPVPGAFDWIARAMAFFSVHIYSRRSISVDGRAAMQAWFRKHGGEGLLPDITFAHEKPAAFLQIDDRAICFMGDWSQLDPELLRQFKPWNRR